MRGNEIFNIFIILVTRQSAELSFATQHDVNTAKKYTVIVGTYLLNLKKLCDTPFLLSE